MKSNAWLGAGFIESVRRFPNRPAMYVRDQEFTYAELYDRAAATAATLAANTPHGGSPLTAVFAARCESAYVGVLAALLRGHGYVPLNPSFPVHRTRIMLERSECRAVVVDPEEIETFAKIADDFDQPLLLICSDKAASIKLAALLPRHRVLDVERSAAKDFHPTVPDENDVAYLLFTSGSTGVPKGVAVSHANICRFLSVMQDRYRLDENDRLSQMFDLVFDLSVFDLFMAWLVGAKVCSPSREEVLLPAEFIQNAQLTVWFSVPSAAVLMNRLGLLSDGAFPNLRLSLFCGEALPVDATRAWASAACNSAVENLYGPTELTLACMLYQWRGAESEEETIDGIVPIGAPYPGMIARVVDESLVEVPPGDTGELMMSGPQVALGYWRDEALTSKAFVRPPGCNERYYRTGDLVRRPMGDEPMTYLGRVDHQIKIRGSRVELGEIEATLKDISGAAQAVALGWPVNASGADGVVAFLETDRADVPAILEAARTRLPGYMVPKQIRLIARFPLTSNGKIDRNALKELLDK